uniref:Uncharacterized protein n=1 Tax=Arundo donax TaxID=35708 RepID=A0A0A9C346_ARUDO
MLSLERKWHTATSPGLRLCATKNGFLGLHRHVSRWHAASASMAGALPSSAAIVTMYMAAGFVVWQ